MPSRHSRVHLERHELDSLLEGQLDMIRSIVSPRAVADALPAIRAAVEKRIQHVETAVQLTRLIHDAAHDEALWPNVARAMQGDRNEFGILWVRVQEKVLPV